MPLSATVRGRGSPRNGAGDGSNNMTSVRAAELSPVPCSPESSNTACGISGRSAADKPADNPGPAFVSHVEQVAQLRKRGTPRSGIGRRASSAVRRTARGNVDDFPRAGSHDDSEAFGIPEVNHHTVTLSGQSQMYRLGLRVQRLAREHVQGIGERPERLASVRSLGDNSEQVWRGTRRPSLSA